MAHGRSSRAVICKTCQQQGLRRYSPLFAAVRRCSPRFAAVRRGMHARKAEPIGWLHRRAGRAPLACRQGTLASRPQGEGRLRSHAFSLSFRSADWFILFVGVGGRPQPQGRQPWLEWQLGRGAMAGFRGTFSSVSRAFAVFFFAQPSALVRCRPPAVAADRKRIEIFILYVYLLRQDCNFHNSLF